MILEISKKLIFFSFLFLNFIPPSESADLQKITKKYIPPSSKLNFLKNSNKKFLKRNEELFLANFRGNQNELEIKSDKQSEINNVIYAEGNVSVTYGGKLLKADYLTYEKLNKKIFAKGNIA